MSAKPTIEEMAAHIVSEVQYDMRHGKPVSSSCEYAERRLKEMVAAAREEGRAAGYAEAIEKAAKVAREMIDSAAHHAGLAYKDNQEEEAELHEQAGNAAKTILRGLRALAPANKEKP